MVNTCSLVFSQAPDTCVNTCVHLLILCSRCIVFTLVFTQAPDTCVNTCVHRKGACVHHLGWAGSTRQGWRRRSLCGRLPVHQVCVVPPGGMSHSPDRRCAYSLALLSYYLQHHCSPQGNPMSPPRLLSCIVVSHVYKSPLTHFYQILL